MNYFQLYINDVRIRSIDGLIESFNHMTHCKVQRRRCFPFPYTYFHHFIILHINQHEMTVAHYSPVLPVLIGNSKTFGKFVIETFQFEEQDNSSPREESGPCCLSSCPNKPKKPCNILDFSEGVYLVPSSSERRSRHEAVFRLLKRQNESQYNVCFNNCEHIVNDILYKTPTSNQSESMVCCSNIIGGLLDLRGIGVRIVMMVLIVAALLGGFVRQTLIRVLASAIVISLEDKGENTCNHTDLGAFIIRNLLQKEINRTITYLKNREIDLHDITLTKLHEMLSNSLVCSTADFLARIDIYWLMLISILFISCFEIILTYNHVYYGLGSLVGKISPYMIWREFWLRIVSGCLANITACIVGYYTVSTLTAPNPYFIYFLTYVPLTVALRYLFIVILGICCDAMYPRCGILQTYFRKAQHRRSHLISGFLLPVVTFALMLVVLTSVFSGDILSITSMS